MLNIEVGLHGAAISRAERRHGLGLQQRQHQVPGLLVQLVVAARIGGERIESLAHLGVALAQYADLFFHQRYRTARGVVHVQEVQHVRVALQKVAVILQVFANAVVGQCVAVGSDGRFVPG